MNQKMKAAKFIYNLIIAVCFSTIANEGDVPEFKDYNISLSDGPFAKKINLTNEQLKKSEEWKRIIQKQLNEQINFAGHYRLYISEKGQL